jgi:molybdate transport system substrate-binding protein
MVTGLPTLGVVSVPGLTVYACALAIAVAGSAWRSVVRAARAEDVRLLSAAALPSVFKEIRDEFERVSDHRLTIEYGTTGGITQRILTGSRPDVVIASVLTMPDLVRAEIDPRTQIVVCKVGVGLVVPEPTPPPRLESVADLKQALMAAKVVDPVRGGAARIHVARVLERLELAEQLRPKIRLAAGGDITAVTLSQGEGALGLTQISEIVEKSGASFVGPLPAEVQNYAVFVAGVTMGASQPGADAFLRFLRSPAAISLMKGMEIQ